MSNPQPSSMAMAMHSMLWHAERLGVGGGPGVVAEFGHAFVNKYSGQSQSTSQENHIVQL
jgi:hypothetical protein